MISALEACQLASDIYKPHPELQFKYVLDVEGVYCGFEAGSITFRGSATTVDWVHDFNTLPTLHPQIGTIATGFLIGMEAAFKTLQPFFSEGLCIQGHSLGAAHAAILAALCTVNGIPVQQLCLFAPPRVGSNYLRRLIEGGVGKTYAFRNADDVVPLVPLFYEPVADYVRLDMPTGDPFEDHRVARYLEGVAAWSTSNQT